MIVTVGITAILTTAVNVLLVAIFVHVRRNRSLFSQ
ncbi:hypothetical protein EDC15_12226 [Acetobacter aceti NBRC 14818]|nr:hypothetical protein EDC15_12226 [Acetobacter aceti NBRC 14818]